MYQQQTTVNKTTPDFLIERRSSCVRFHPLTDKAGYFLQIFEDDSSYHGESLEVESRQALNLAEVMELLGLELS